MDAARKTVMLPLRDLLAGSRHPEALAAVVAAAEQALRTWQPAWSGFLDGAAREEAEARLAGLSELAVQAEGGYPGAERCRLLLQRREAWRAPQELLDEQRLLSQRWASERESHPKLPPQAGFGEPAELGKSEGFSESDGLSESEEFSEERELSGQKELSEAAGAALMGLELSGNFLFDPATAEELRAALLAAGAPAEQLGDLWLRGDRGGQAICCAALARQLDGRTIQIRTVEVSLQARPLEELRLPMARQPRRFSSVEASLRLDAVASAGFGISRSRMAELIRAGSVRLNWQPVTSPSRELKAGDRIQLSGRGELEIEGVQATKRERWRIELLRR